VTTSYEELKGQPFNPAAAAAVMASIQGDYLRYKELRDRGDMRSFASDQLHEDLGFMLWAYENLQRRTP
jgi:hypothetical protein